MINDHAREVAFILDKDFMRHEGVNFHPLRKNKTVSLLLADSLDVMEILEHGLQIIAIPELKE